MFCYVTRYHPGRTTNAATGEESWGIFFHDYRDGVRFCPPHRDGYQGHYGDATLEAAQRRCRDMNERAAKRLCETPEGDAQYAAWLHAEREQRERGEGR